MVIIVTDCITELKRVNEALMIKNYTEKLQQAIRETQQSKAQLIHEHAVNLGYSPPRGASPAAQPRSRIMSGRVRGAKVDTSQRSSEQYAMLQKSIDDGGLLECETKFVYPDGRVRPSSREAPQRRVRAEGGSNMPRRHPSADPHRSGQEYDVYRPINSAPNAEVMPRRQRRNMDFPWEDVADERLRRLATIDKKISAPTNHDSLSSLLQNFIDEDGKVSGCPIDG